MPVKGLSGDAQNIARNLTAGAKGRGILTVTIDGFTRDNFLVKITRAVHDLDKNLKNKHVTLLRELGKRAKANLYSSIRRPGESGERQDIRQTKRFTFGTRAESGGGAFVGVLIDNDNETGFGYPDIAQADRKTKYIWRTLEFGIGPRGTNHPEGPRGVPKLPQRFGFTGPSPGTAKLVVLKGPAVASGATYVQMFKTKQRRKNVAKKKKVDPQGQVAKLFITRAIDDMVGKVGKEYAKAAAESYGKL